MGSFIVFWDITPYSQSKVNRHFGETCRPHLQGRVIRRARTQLESRWQAELEKSLKMEPKVFSETSVDFGRYIQEERILYDHRCENLRSYITGYILSSDT
jgi:hypothetical protein